MRSINILALSALLSTSAIKHKTASKFYDYDEEENNDMVAKAAKSMNMGQQMNIPIDKSDLKIGRFSFSDALDFSEGANLQKLDGIMMKEYEQQYNAVDSHNRQVIADRKNQLERENQIKREQSAKQQVLASKLERFSDPMSMGLGSNNGIQSVNNEDDAPSDDRSNYFKAEEVPQDDLMQQKMDPKDDPSQDDIGAAAGGDTADGESLSVVVAPKKKEQKAESKITVDTFGDKVKSTYNAQNPEGMHSSSRNQTGYILPPPIISAIGDENENPTELGFEKQTKPSYVWADNDITDITNTHDTGLRVSQRSDDPENAPAIDVSKINGDMESISSWMSDAANNGDSEPAKPMDDVAQVVADFTRLD